MDSICHFIFIYIEDVGAFIAGFLTVNNINKCQNRIPGLFGICTRIKYVKNNVTRINGDKKPVTSTNKYRRTKALVVVTVTGGISSLSGISGNIWPTAMLIPPSSSTSKESGTTFEIRDKLRVLCLHGYRQNGDVMRSKLGSLRKQVAKYAEFVFITAPHRAAPLQPGAEVPPEQRSWWANKDDGTFKGTNKGGPAFGFQESLRFVEEAWRSQGPFQGLLGFSQGACFVGLICGFSKKKLTSIKPDFAILASGFPSGSLVHKSAYEESITIPTLHIYGTSDEIIPKKMSQDLALHFKNKVVVEHDGGHYFPASAQQKQTYVNFFQDRLQEYLEHLELQNSSNIVFVDEHADDTSNENLDDTD